MCAAKGKAKVNSFATLRGFNYTTRANIAHEEAEQIRARIACTPAEKKIGGRGCDMCADGIKNAFFILSIGLLGFLSCRGRLTLSRRR